MLSDCRSYDGIATRQDHFHRAHPGLLITYLREEIHSVNRTTEVSRNDPDHPLLCGREVV